MDPHNPRWMTSEERRAKSATMWKIIVGAVSASALSAIMVASCLDRDDEARRDDAEPGITETTAANVGATAPAGTSTSDSTGGIAPTGAAGSTTVTSGAMNLGGVPADDARAANGGNVGATNMSRAPVNFESANNVTVNLSGGGTVDPTTGQPISGHASHAANDPGNRPDDGLGINGLTNTAPGGTAATGGQVAPGGTTTTSHQVAPAGNATTGAAGRRNTTGSNPGAPPMSAGAGAFVTEAPPDRASSWESPANAGAGAFTTERSMPGTVVFPGVQGNQAGNQGSASGAPTTPPAPTVAPTPTAPAAPTVTAAPTAPMPAPAAASPAR